MNPMNSAASPDASVLTNGSGAAAILSAGIGSFALAVLACAGDKLAAVKNSLIFYKPTGPLSGVTTTAILIWLVAWGILEWRWRNRTVGVGRISVVALALLGLSLMLTFPPVVDLF
ncbi:MAG: hypothetical protein ABSA39_19465 [Edaphobacter sp.]|jgi:hypothetical protein|uniref:hypothetical protein n=1 Tax=Terracidiphilus sp. TaxID=1964191 RepID=UPI003C28A23D